MGCSAGTNIINDTIKAKTDVKFKNKDNKLPSKENIITSRLNDNNTKNSSKNKLNHKKDEMSFEGIVNNLLVSKNFESKLWKLMKLSYYKLKYINVQDNISLNYFSEKQFSLSKESDFYQIYFENNEKYRGLLKEISNAAKKFKKNFNIDGGMNILDKLSREFNVICINNAVEKVIKIKDNKTLLLLFFDIINIEAIHKTKEIYNNIKENKYSKDFLFLPILNYFYSKDDFTFQKDFISRVGLEVYDIFLLVKDTIIAEMFGLLNITTSRVYIIGPDGIVKFTGEADKLIIRELNFYLNIELIEKSRNNNNTLLINQNLFDDLTFNSIKFRLKQDSEKIKNILMTSKINSCEMVLFKVRIYNGLHNLEEYRFPIKVCIENDNENKQSLVYTNYLAKEMKNYFIYEMVNIRQQDKLKEVITVLSSKLRNNLSFYQSADVSIIKRINKQYNSKTKTLVSKSCNFCFNFLLINKNFSDNMENIQSFLSDLIYTNPDISKMKLRYMINPKEGLQYNKTLKGYKYEDYCKDLLIVSKDFSSNYKYIIILHSNVQYLDNTLKVNISHYFKFLIDNKMKYEIDLFFIIFGLNKNENMKIKQMLGLEKQESFFWYLTSSAFTQFNIYYEDFSILSLVLDRELRLMYVDETNEMKKEIYENKMLVSSKNILKHLLYFSLKIDKENFKKIQILFEKFCKDINLLMDKKYNQNLNPHSNLNYNKIITFNTKQEIKSIFYKNPRLDIKIPDFFLDDLNEALDNLLEDMNRLDEELGIYVGKSIKVYETFLINTQKIEQCSSCKCKVMIEKVFYCKICEDNFCEDCESKINNYINNDILNTNNKSERELLKTNTVSIHEHNLIFISLKESTNTILCKYYIYSCLYENYMESNKDLLSYKKCCICEGYIYPDSKTIYLNLTEMSNASMINMEQFICNDLCFAKLCSGEIDELMTANMSKNKINRKSLLLLKIYQKVVN